MGETQQFNTRYFEMILRLLLKNTHKSAHEPKEFPNLRICVSILCGHIYVLTIVLYDFKRTKIYLAIF